MTDRLYNKKLALMPFTSGGTEPDSGDLIRKISAIGSEQFFCFVTANRLAPLWFDYLTGTGMTDQIPSPILENLKRQKLNEIAVHLMQKRVLDQVHQIFEAENIPYLVFKGAALRYSIYDDPAHRPSADIDILINPSDKESAVACLAKAGFDYYCDEQNISHEVTLTRHSVAIDLHWAILRPGRTRTDIAQYLFANRIRLQHCWALNHQASLFVMLVHPVFTKHLNSPFSLLIHLVDLHKLIQCGEYNWDLLVDKLGETGTRTAAWSSLYWLEKNTGTSAPRDVMDRLQPRYAKEQILRTWINRRYPERLTNFQRQILRAFSLVMHDSISDALFFLVALAKETRLASEKAAKLNTVYEANRITASAANSGNSNNSIAPGRARHN
jgi:hypothetical protein